MVVFFLLLNTWSKKLSRDNRERLEIWKTHGLKSLKPILDSVNIKMQLGKSDLNINLLKLKVYMWLQNSIK